MRRHFFLVRVADYWNNLPANIKDSPTVKAFKIKYAHCPTYKWTNCVAEEATARNEANQQAIW